MNRAVAGADFQDAAASVQFAAHRRPVERPGDGDRDVDGDAAVARVGVELRVQIAGDAKSDASVAGMQVPAVRYLRSVCGGGINAAIARLNLQGVESSIEGDVPVACIDLKSAVHTGAVDAAVAGVEVNPAVEAIGLNITVAGSDADIARDGLRGDVAVAGGHVEIQAAGDAQVNVDRSATAPESPMEMRHADADVHAVAALAFFDADIVGAELVAVGRDVRVDVFLIRRSDGDAAIVGLHVEVGAAADGVRLRPIVGARSWRRGGHGYCRKQNAR